MIHPTNAESSPPVESGTWTADAGIAFYTHLDHRGPAIELRFPVAEVLETTAVVGFIGTTAVRAEFRDDDKGKYLLIKPVAPSVGSPRWPRHTARVVCNAMGFPKLAMTCDGKTTWLEIDAGVSEAIQVRCGLDKAVRDTRQSAHFAIKKIANHQER